MILNRMLCWTQYQHHATSSGLAQEHCWETPKSLHTPTPKILSRKVSSDTSGSKYSQGGSARRQEL